MLSQVLTMMILLTHRATCSVFQYVSVNVEPDATDTDGDAVDEVVCMLPLDEENDIMKRLAELFEVDMCRRCCFETCEPWTIEDR